jgi:hypothetical protein
MSYDLDARLAHFEETGTEPTVSDFYRMLEHHAANRREIERKREERNNKKRKLYDQMEAEELSQSQKRKQKADLMATSKFNVASIMPQVKSLVADKQFEASGNASQSVIGDSTVSAKGGRRTKRHKRSGKSGHKRVHKKKCMSRRR